jgi:hypothetical protein
MAKTQSVILSGDHFNVAGNISINVAGIAMSPDGKKLATTDATRGIRLYESHDLTIQKYVHGTEHTPDEVVGPTVGPSRLILLADSMRLVALMAE